MSALECLICMQRVEDAHLCRGCGKPCCKTCISRWLTHHSNACPHCRTRGTIDEWVRCAWVDDLVEQGDVQGQGGEDGEEQRCEEHSDGLSVYCKTCKAMACPQCVLWHSQHSGHELCPLRQHFDICAVELRERADKYRDHIGRLGEQLQKTETRSELVKRETHKAQRQIRACTEESLSTLSSHAVRQLSGVHETRRRLTNMVHSLDARVRHIESMVDETNMARLVGRMDDIRKGLDELEGEDADEDLPPSPRVESFEQFLEHVQPPFESCKFDVHMNRESSARAVYSPLLKVDGMAWRLKVHTIGIDESAQGHFSLFIELAQGPPMKIKFDYTVQLLVDDRLLQERQSCNSFEVGECWGYNRFFSNEGLDNAIVTFSFAVRTPTYYSKCQVMKWYVTVLNLIYMIRHMSNMTVGDVSLENSVSRSPINHNQAIDTSGSDTEEERLEHFAAIITSLQDDSTDSDAPVERKAVPGRHMTTRIYGGLRQSSSSDTDC